MTIVVRRNCAPVRLTTAWMLSFATLFLTIIGYQWVTGAFEDEFYYEDTATHFVTGVMVADYGRRGFGDDPVAFAEQFYLRSPKVAFGRWPPLFHLLQGCFYLAVGASKGSAMALVAAISAAAGAVLFQRLWERFGVFVAALGVLTFFGFDEIRHHSRFVMSDLLTILLCTLAVFAIADFLAWRRWRDLVLFSTWSLLAMLTKETALHLVILAPAAFLCIEGRKNLRDWRILAVIAAMLAIATGLLALRLYAGLGVHGYRSVGQLLANTMGRGDRLAVMGAFVGVAPACVFVLAACGWLASEFSRGDPEWRVMPRLAVLWVLSLPALYMVSPAPPTSRYFLPVVMPLTILMACGLDAMRTACAVSSSKSWLLPAAACGMAIWAMPQRPSPAGVRGYAAVATAIPVETNLVTLISSEPFGEGAYVCERLLADREQVGIVVRGSKVLSTSDWQGTGYRQLKTTVGEVYNYLCDLPVHYVVLDQHRREGSPLSPDRALLARALQDHASDFRAIGQYPLTRGGFRQEAAMIVYENLRARGRQPQSLCVELEHALGRTLHLKVTPAAR